MFIPKIVRASSIDHLGIIKALIDETEICTTIDRCIGPNKVPVDLLLGEGIQAQDLNDDSLGTALDALYASGVTETFYRVSSKALTKMGITHNFVHLDSTSFSLH